MNGWWGGHMDGFGGMGVGGMVLAGVLLVVIGAVGARLLLAARTRPTPAPVHHHGPGAQEVLGRRFAEGDIDEAEYRWRLGILDEDP